MTQHDTVSRLLNKMQTKEEKMRKKMKKNTMKEMEWPESDKILFDAGHFHVRAFS